MSDTPKVESIQKIDSGDDISLKNFINKLKEYYREILKGWLLMLLLAAVFISYLAYKALTAPLVYPAKMTFMVNEESGGGSAGVGGLLSQFGFGSSGGSEYNLSKVIELSKSREIAKRALFTIDSSLAQPDYLINEFMTTYQLKENWSENNSPLANVTFKHDDFKKFSREENTVLKIIHTILVGGEDGGGIVKIAVNSETSIFNMQVNGKEEMLSINLLKALYNSLSDFYISETIEKPKTTYDKLKIRTDSVRKELVSLEYRLARSIDTNRGLVSREAQLQTDRLDRNLRATGAEYAKLIESLGASEFTLENATPVFQVVDEVLEPVFPVKPSLVRAIAIGGAIGIFLGILFVLLRKIYRDAMEE